jgi:hypothetical protein
LIRSKPHPTVRHAALSSRHARPLSRRRHPQREDDGRIRGLERQLRLRPYREIRDYRAGKKIAGRVQLVVGGVGSAPLRGAWRELREKLK